VTTDADAAAKAEQRGDAQHVRRFCFVDRGGSPPGSRKETECMHQFLSGSAKYLLS
jgi:hypothetical protein